MGNLLLERDKALYMKISIRRGRKRKNEVVGLCIWIRKDATNII